MFNTKITTSLVAIALAGGSILIGASAASAAPPASCTQSPGVPYETGGILYGSGTGSCNSLDQRTLNYEMHRSEGWWHPLVALGINSGYKLEYEATASDCDAGSGDGIWEYFGQVWFSGYDWTQSGNSANSYVCG